MVTRQWTRDHKLQLWAIVVAAVVAVAAIVVPLVLTNGGGGKSATVGTNNGQVNVDAKVINNYYNPTQQAGLTNQNSSATTYCPDLGPANPNSEGAVVELFGKPMNDPDACWSQHFALARTPVQLKLMIRYVNVGKTIAHDVITRANLAPNEALVPGTTYLYDSTYPHGVFLKGDYVTGGGYDVGSFSAGAVLYLTFEVITPGPDALRCGRTSFKTVGIAHPKKANEFYNVLNVDLDKVCASSTPSR